MRVCARVSYFVSCSAVSGVQNYLCHNKKTFRTSFLIEYAKGFHSVILKFERKAVSPQTDCYKVLHKSRSALKAVHGCPAR